MSGKSKQQIRIANLLEKSHHINAESLEDPTIINHLRLLEWIIDKEEHNTNYYLHGLYDDEESKERIEKIDYLRQIGAGTKLENEMWMEKYKKQTNSNRNKSGGCKTKVINKYAGTEEEFKTLKAACEEYDLNYETVKTYFTKQKTKEVTYKGLIIRKLN